MGLLGTWTWGVMLVVAAVVAMAVPGCGCDESPAADGDTDTDTSTGADSDTDVDADTDADTDTGSSICQEGPLELEWTPLPEGIDCGPGCRQLTFAPINSITGWEASGQILAASLDSLGPALLVDLTLSRQAHMEPNSLTDGVGYLGEAAATGRAAAFALGADESPQWARSIVVIDTSLSKYTEIHRSSDDIAAARGYKDVTFSGETVCFLLTGPDISGAKSVHCSTWAECDLQNIASDLEKRFYTEMSDTHLVWGQGSTDCHGDIWAHNLTTKETWNLTDHEADQFMPRIDGTRVVWTDNRNGPGGFVNADIYVHDFSTGDTTRLTDGEWIQMKPDISGNTVVFEDYRASADPNSQGSFGGMDIWMVDISTGAQTQLTSFPGPEGDPQIVGDKLYYYRQVPGETYFAVFEQDLTALGM